MTEQVGAERRSAMQPASTVAPARRQLTRRAALVGVTMRNGINVLLSVIALADPTARPGPGMTVLLVVLAAWSAWRVVTRSFVAVVQVIDLCLVLSVVAATSSVAPVADFSLSNTTTQAMAGTAIGSFAVSVRPSMSAVIAVSVAATYAWGVSVGGAYGAWTQPVLILFAGQWLAGSSLRWMVVRVATAVDVARADRAAAESENRARAAVADYDREQVSLLHDTAASTLLMVGQGSWISRDRLASQAERDLRLLGESLWEAPPVRVEIVAELRRAAEYLRTPVRFEGLPQLWLRGETAKAVIGAAREAMTNVDRHAGAPEVEICVNSQFVRIRDDGKGFDAAAPRSGHGLSESIAGRMDRAGGTAVIVASPGSGCDVELHWSADRPTPDPADVDDPDHLIARIRHYFGLALAGYALSNLTFMVSYVSDPAGRPLAQRVLAMTAAAATFACLTGIVRPRTGVARMGVAVLLIVAIAQPALLPDDMVGGPAHWALGAIGWCVLPALLSLSVREGTAVLVAFWAVSAIAVFVRVPALPTLISIGVGTASILGPQLFAVVFNGLVRGAAEQAHSETEAHKRWLVAERTRHAVRAEYEDRYAELVSNVVPVLEAVRSPSTPIDVGLQRHARSQSRRLRTLFEQAPIFDDPLLRRLRLLADAAERRGMDVTVGVTGTSRELSSADAETLVGPIQRALEWPARSARVRVCLEWEQVTASVVCRGLDADRIAEPSPPESTAPGLHLSTIEGDGAVWLLACLRQGRHLPSKPHNDSAARSPQH